HEAAIGACHRAVAERLRALGDAQSAAVVEEAAAAPTRPPAGEPSVPEPIPDSDNPVRLLTAAQAPLEALGDTLEKVMRGIEGDLFAAAEKALANVIGRIAKIALQAEQRMGARERAG